MSLLLAEAFEIIGSVMLRAWVRRLSCQGGRGVRVPGVVSRRWVPLGL